MRGERYPIEQLGYLSPLFALEQNGARRPPRSGCCGLTRYERLGDLAQLVEDLLEILRPVDGVVLPGDRLLLAPLLDRAQVSHERRERLHDPGERGGGVLLAGLAAQPGLRVVQKLPGLAEHLVADPVRPQDLLDARNLAVDPPGQTLAHVADEQGEFLLDLLGLVVRRSLSEASLLPGVDPGAEPLGLSDVVRAGTTREPVPVLPEEGDFGGEDRELAPTHLLDERVEPLPDALGRDGRRLLAGLATQPGRGLCIELFGVVDELLAEAMHLHPAQEARDLVVELLTRGGAGLLGGLCAHVDQAPLIGMDNRGRRVSGDQSSGQRLCCHRRHRRWPQAWVPVLLAAKEPAQAIASDCLRSPSLPYMCMASPLSSSGTSSEPPYHRKNRGRRNTGRARTCRRRIVLLLWRVSGRTI
ncbi:hypothetical protein [Reticulibacter mediterranei]|uniref:hypothetical protein n=1 Tax=Reticulibacter mediterranei TaxID=2778369 RepID=UPI001C690C88|nr:hypothetical protein [Reticulibacter mediterranei]